MAPTFFDGLKKNFKDVPVSADDKISTSEFLEAAESLVTLFDILGSTAFSVVQKDMTGNIKVRNTLCYDTLIFDCFANEMRLENP